MGRVFGVGEGGDHRNNITPFQRRHLPQTLQDSIFSQDNLSGEKMKRRKVS